MKISRLFLFGFLSVLSCSSPTSEKISDLGLTIDLGKIKSSDMDREYIDVSDTDNRTDVAKDMLAEDVELDFDPKKYEMCFDEGVVKIDEVEPALLDEISGIAASRTQDIIWVHNDSGDEDGQFYAIDFEGNLRGTFVLEGARSIDWEDMAIVEKDGKTYLYFGDMGDNAARAGNVGRSDIRVYRTEEPRVDLTNNPNTAVSIADFETYTFTYPEKATDCEALFVDPRTGDLFFLEKKNAGKVYFFRAAQPVDGSTTTLESLVGLDIPTLEFPGSSTTAGSISPDRKWIIVKTYTSVLLFPWRQNESFSAAVSIAPIILPVPREIQGESIDFAVVNGESGVITISEGANPAINFIKDTCK